MKMLVILMIEVVEVIEVISNIVMKMVEVRRNIGGL